MDMWSIWRPRQQSQWTLSRQPHIALSASCVTFRSQTGLSFNSFLPLFIFPISVQLFFLRTGFHVVSCVCQLMVAFVVSSGNLITHAATPHLNANETGWSGGQVRKGVVIQKWYRWRGVMVRAAVCVASASLSFYLFHVVLILSFLPFLQLLSSLHSHPLYCHTLRLLLFWSPFPFSFI